jgi:hypothetical protein
MRKITFPSMGRRNEKEFEKCSIKARKTLTGGRHEPFFTPENPGQNNILSEECLYLKKEEDLATLYPYQQVW